MKKNIAILLVVIVLVSATGCAAETQPATSTPAPVAAPTPAAAETAGSPDVANIVQERPLILYANDFTDEIPELFYQATGLVVEVVHGSGGEIMARLAAEQANPLWDVVWTDAFYSIHNFGLTGQFAEGWVPENLSHMSDLGLGMMPGNYMWFPTGIHAAGLIAYNQNLVSAEDAPRTWEDFLNPNFQAGMADPAAAAPAYPLVVGLFHLFGGIEGGQAFFDTLFDNGASVFPRNGPVALALTGGDVNVALLQEANVYGLLRNGEPIGVVWPDEGAPASVRVAAIQRNTDNLEVAQAFIEFLLDPTTQQALIDLDDEIFEAMANGVTPNPNRIHTGSFILPDVDWGAQHEAEIKEWFADAAVR